MSFHHKYNSEYTINSHTIPLSSSCKNLGIIFTNTLSWREHYEMIISKAYKSFGLLHRVFKDSHSPVARKSLYISLVCSSLLYCSPLWRLYLLKDITLLEQVQRRAMKFILSDYTSDYKTRLMKLGILPRMYTFEIAGIMFLINSVKNASNKFNILDFVSFHSGPSTMVNLTTKLQLLTKL